MKQTKEGRKEEETESTDLSCSCMSPHVDYKLIPWTSRSQCIETTAMMMMMMINILCVVTRKTVEPWQWNERSGFDSRPSYFPLTTTFRTANIKWAKEILYAVSKVGRIMKLIARLRLVPMLMCGTLVVCISYAFMTSPFEISALIPQWKPDYFSLWLVIQNHVRPVHTSIMN
jgi:hypothetical protein